MNIETFSEKFGIIKNQGTYFTYEPKLLPFKTDYLITLNILNLVEEVSFKFGSLNNYVSKVENIDLLLAPYLKKEALSSSTIEGTRSSLDEVFLSENEIKLETKDSQEVLNYSKALEFGLKEIQIRDIDEKLIKDIHRILMSGVRGEDKSPGKFKVDINWINGVDPHDAEFVPPHPTSIDSLIKNLCEYIQKEDNENIFLKTAIIHYQFETIHPFRDGNGRIGRLLIILFLCKQSKLKKPLIYVSGFFEKYKKEYMLKLQNVRENAEMVEWIEFFLKGLKIQADKSIIKLEKLNNYKMEIERRIRDKTNSNHTLNAVNLLFKNPYVKITDIQNYLGVQYTMAKFVIDKLLEENIIEKIGKNERNKKYLAREIFNIIYED